MKSVVNRPISQKSFNQLVKKGLIRELYQKKQITKLQFERLMERQQIN